MAVLFSRQGLQSRLLFLFVLLPLLLQFLVLEVGGLELARLPVFILSLGLKDPFCPLSFRLALSLQQRLHNPVALVLQFLDFRCFLPRG
jgi:hypothetical protein